MRLLRHLSLPPGRYQLRVAAQDSGKVKQGSAHFDLDVPDFTKESDRAQQRRARRDGRSLGVLAAETRIRSVQRLAAGPAVGTSRVSGQQRD